jgi:hypothetical protein
MRAWQKAAVCAGLGVLGFSSYLLYDNLSNKVPAQKNESQYPWKSSLPLKKTQDLEVTSNNKKYGYLAVTENTDEASGIEQICDFLMEDPPEEAWCYLPDKKMWIETGISSGLIGKPRQDGKFDLVGEVQTDHTLDLEILKKEKNIIDFHFHPTYLAQDLFGKHLDTREKRYHWNAPHMVMWYALPSAADIFRMMQDTWIMFKEQGEDVHYVAKIVSSYGITEYSTTKDALLHFGKLAVDTGKYPEDFIDPWTKQLTASTMHYCEDTVTDPDVLIQRIAADLSKEYISVKITPHPPALREKFRKRFEELDEKVHK